MSWADYGKWPEMARRAWEAGLRAAEKTRPPDKDRLVVVGMGASGVIGDYLSVIVEETPILVFKQPWLPRWVGRGDLVLVISRSGETPETLHALRQALEKGASTVFLASGGRMARMAEEHGGRIPLVRLEPSLPTRTVLPQILFAALGILQGLGIHYTPGEEREEACRIVAGERPEDYRELGAFIAGGLPVIAGWGPIWPALTTWRIHLAEDAYLPALVEAYPESGHSDLVVWRNPPRADYRFLLIRTPGDEPLEIVRDAFSDIGEVRELRLRGKSLLARLMHAAIAAAYTSLNAAAARGRPPGRGPGIPEFKAKVRESLGE